MALRNDGDVIRGVGFVAIYAAYVEEAVDELLALLQPIEMDDESLDKAPTSVKLKSIKKRLLLLDDPQFGDLIENIEACRRLLEARNELLHGRIYAQIGGPDMLHSARSGIPKRPVTSIETYDLANQLNSCRSELIRPRLFKLPRAINEYINRANR